jgi:hypothetical protein
MSRSARIVHAAMICVITFLPIVRPPSTPNVQLAVEGAKTDPLKRQRDLDEIGDGKCGQMHFPGILNHIVIYHAQAFN